MTPPRMQTADPVVDDPTAVSACPAPVGIAIAMLARRADFLRAAQARRQGAQGFLLQARRRAEGEASGIRIGYTCSKKVGNAVMRNRARRRLRAIAREVFPRLGRDGWDYVLVGRPGVTVIRPYAELLADLEAAVTSVHSPGRNRPVRGA